MTCGYMPDGSTFNGQTNVLPPEYLATLSRGRRPRQRRAEPPAVSRAGRGRRRLKPPDRALDDRRRRKPGRSADRRMEMRANLPMEGTMTVRAPIPREVPGPSRSPLADPRRDRDRAHGRSAPRLVLRRGRPGATGPTCRRGRGGADQVGTAGTGRSASSIPPMGREPEEGDRHRLLRRSQPSGPSTPRDGHAVSEWEISAADYRLERGGDAKFQDAEYVIHFEDPEVQAGVSPTSATTASRRRTSPSPSAVSSTATGSPSSSTVPTTACPCPSRSSNPGPDSGKTSISSRGRGTTDEPRRTGEVPAIHKYRCSTRQESARASQVP